MNEEREAPDLNTLIEEWIAEDNNETPAIDIFRAGNSQNHEQRVRRTQRISDRRVNRRRQRTRGRRQIQRPPRRAQIDLARNFIQSNLFSPTEHHIPVVAYNGSFIKIKRLTASSNNVNPKVYTCSIFGELNEIQETFESQYWWFDIMCPICLNHNSEILIYTCGHVICYQCFLHIGSQLEQEESGYTSLPISAKKACTICRCIFSGFSFVDKLSPMIFNPETKTFFTPFTHYFDVKNHTFVIATLFNKSPSLLIFKNLNKWDEIQKFKDSFMLSHNFTSLTKLHVNDCDGHLYLQKLDN